MRRHYKHHYTMTATDRPNRITPNFDRMAIAGTTCSTLHLQHQLGTGGLVDAGRPTALVQQNWGSVEIDDTHGDAGPTCTSSQGLSKPTSRSSTNNVSDAAVCRVLKRRSLRARAAHLVWPQACAR